jgi:hypothetical protein
VLRTSLLVAVATWATLPSRAEGHELWLERAADGFVLRGGHRGGEAVAVDPAKVKVVRCVRAGEPARALTPAASGPELRVSARCDAISALVEHGFFVLTPDGERNVPRTEAPDAVESWRSRQLAKWVDARSASAAAPLGDLLELVPITDLARARRGGKVTVRVLLEGKPVAGAVVSIGHEALAETGRSGEARVAVRHAGAETISAVVRRPLGVPEAETDVLEASLTFEVSP